MKDKKEEKKSGKVSDAKKKPEAKSEKKALKIIGFILGITGIFTAWIPLFNILVIICSIIGVIFCIIALKHSEKKGLAIAGLILNILSICIAIFVLLLALIAYSFIAMLGFGGTNLTYTDYSIGQKISAGNISITVLSADKSTQIKNNQEKTIPIETTGYFLSIKVILENTGTETRYYTGDPFNAVIDSQGRTFSALSDAEGYYPNAITAGTQVQPGVLFNGIKIFEIPKDSSGLKLKMKLNNEEGAYVRLD